jgi:hypothetical protein
MAYSLQYIAPSLWVIGYPLKMLGVDLRRNVSIIRLSSGKLVIHSTGPFSRADVARIGHLGEPAWLVDAMLRHDTFAREGHDAFPLIPYLAPEGFSAESGIDTISLTPPPAEWLGELEVLKLEGAPEFDEHVMLHRASRTLIVADLVVNFGPHQNLWSKVLLRIATVQGLHNPGVTRLFQKAVKDRSAFNRSLERLLSWDFERVIVGHGEIIEFSGQTKLRDAWKAARFLE